jgi:hypothetical protein
METTSALARWQQMLSRINNSRAISPTQVRDAAHLLSVLILERTEIAEIISIFNNIPPTFSGAKVAGRAIGELIGKVPENTLLNLWKWVNRQPHENRNTVRISSLRGSFSASPNEAFNILAELQDLTKETRERLYSALDGVSAEKLRTMFIGKTVEHAIRKVCLLLLEVATDQRAGDEFKFKILSAILPPIFLFGLQSGAISIRSEMDRVLDRLTKLQRDELAELMPEDVGAEFKALFPSGSQASPNPRTLVLSEPSTSTASEPPVPKPPSPVVLLGPALIEAPSTRNDASIDAPPEELLKPDPISWFDSNIQLFSQARQFCIESKKQTEQQRIYRIRAEEEVSSLCAKLAKAEQQLATIDQLKLSQTGQSEQLRILSAAKEELDAASVELRVERDGLARELAESRLKSQSLMEDLVKLNCAEGDRSRQYDRDLAAARERLRLQAEEEHKTYQRSLKNSLIRVLEHFPRSNFVPDAAISKNFHVMLTQVLEELENHEIRVFEGPTS